MARVAEDSACAHGAGMVRASGNSDGETGRDTPGKVPVKARACLRVMVLEDEPLAAMALEDMLGDLGFTTLGPFMELDEATDFARDHAAEIDVAILDVNIHGDLSFDLAALLLQRNIPFFFCSGYSKESFEARWRRWPNIGKQFSEAGLLTMIEETCGLKV